MPLADSWTKVTNYQQGIEVVLAKVSEYCRKKNKDQEKVAAERDLAVKQKIVVLKQLDEFVVRQGQK